MPIISRPRVLRALPILVLVLFTSACTFHKDESTSTTVDIVALNDFHGYILPSPFSYPDPENPEENITIQAGGISAISGLMTELRAQYPDLIFVGAGDLIGASPPISQLYADEPSIQALNLLDLDYSAVGNHEMDEGKVELLRQINGGCESPRPKKACQFEPTFSGADYQYIAANLIDTDTNTTLVAPYVMTEQKGVRIAFVGGVVESLSALIPASSMAGVRTIDETDAINAAIPAIEANGADVIIAVLHEGGMGHATFNGCDTLTGAITDIADRMSPEVDVLISGHTHQAYICQYGDLTITQGHHYGHLLTHLQLEVEDGQVVSVEAENLIADPSKYQPTADIAAFEKALVAKTDAVMNRPIARIGASVINRVANETGECAMGDLVADAQLATLASMGAQIALMNYGGIRGDFYLSEGQTHVTFSQVAAIHPFKGTLQLITLTGAQLKEILEQQWTEAGNFNPLQVSEGFTYEWDKSKPRGQKIVASSMQLNSQPIRMSGSYRIATSEFLIGGGDHFTGFAVGTDQKDTGITELSALTSYLEAQDEQGMPAGSGDIDNRIKMR